MTASSDGSVVFFTDGDSAGLTGDTVSGQRQQPVRLQHRKRPLTDLTGNQSAPHR